MRLVLRIFDPRESSAVDVVVAVQSDAREGELLAAVSATLPPNAKLYCGAEPLDPHRKVVDGPIRSGAVLSVGEPGRADRPSAVAGAVEVRVAGGPASGHFGWLGNGTHVIGRLRSATVVVSDPSVSREHVILTVADGVVTAQNRSVSGTTIDGLPLPDVDTVVADDAVLDIGASQVVVGRMPTAAGNVDLRPDGRLVVNRRLRAAAAPPHDTVTFATSFEDFTHSKRGLQLAVMFGLPLVASVALALATHQRALLAFALIGPLSYGGSALIGSRGEKRAASGRHQRRKQVDETAIAQLADAVARERQYLLDQAPDVAQLVLAASGPRVRLWERRDGTDAAFLLRMGSADKVTTVVINGTAPSGTPTLGRVPVSASLIEAGVIGVAGVHAGGVLRSLVLQLATLHSPADLELNVIADPGARIGWDWVRWLPHLRGEDGSCRLGTSPETSAQIVSRLVAALDNRQAQFTERFVTADTVFTPRVVLVIPDVASTERSRDLLRIAAEGPEYGIDVVCGAAWEGKLLEQRRATLVLGAELDDPAVLHGFGKTTGDIAVDLVDAAVAERTARWLAPLSVETDTVRGGGSGVPDSVRLRSLIDGDFFTPDGVARRWSVAPRDLAAVAIGAGADGPVVLDLLRQGPHGVVVGTTNSGKSELLLTAVLSMALTHPPEQLNFVFIDFKGGTGLEHLAVLPHCAGMVSNLDTARAVRAITSLQAELHHREREFGRMGQKEFPQVVAAARDRDERPLARLIVIVDEFLMLQKALGRDFVARFEEIAVTGRGLGVHLLLTTQEPSRIPEEILQNAALRVALRVEDRAASQRVVRTPAAANLPSDRKGRAILAVGTSQIAFQVARVTTAAAGSPATVSVGPVTIEDWANPARTVAAAEEHTAFEHSDAKALVDAICAAAVTRPVARRVFCPPLPPRVELSALLSVGLTGAEVAIGLEDVPERQEQRPFAVDFNRGGLAILGGTRSGRTTALRTVALAAIGRYNADEFQVHAIDTGRNQLRDLTAAAHMGTVASVGDPDQVDRLLSMLAADVVSRAKTLGAAGFDGVGDAWDAGWRQVPYTAVLIDDWDRFAGMWLERDGGVHWDRMRRVFEEGPAVGVVVAVTATPMALRAGSPVASLPQRLVLHCPDGEQYGLAGVPKRLVPTLMPPGRALIPNRTAVMVDGREERQPGLVQIAVAPTTFATTTSATRPPRRLAALPARRVWSPAAEPRPVGGSGYWIPAGVTDVALWVDLAGCAPAFVVAGGEKSGRTTALRTYLAALLAGGANVVIVDPKGSVGDLATASGVIQYCQRDVTSLAAIGVPAVLVVDDVDRLIDAADELATFLDQPQRAGIVAGLTDAWKEAYQLNVLRTSRSGIILLPRSPFDGAVVGRQLMTSTRIVGPEGRGHLIAGGDTHVVQVLLPPVTTVTDAPAPRGG